MQSFVILCISSSVYSMYLARAGEGEGAGAGASALIGCWSFILREPIWVSLACDVDQSPLLRSSIRCGPKIDA